MTRLVAALCAACACMVYGCIRWQGLKDALDTRKTFLAGLEKMETQLRYSAPPLPLLLMQAAPDDAHYFFRLGRAMEMGGALPVGVLMENAGPLPSGLKEPLEKLVEALVAPGADMRLACLEHTRHYLEKETEKARERLANKGKLCLQLSLLGGCALFLLIC